jgi:hypothetical protein
VGLFTSAADLGLSQQAFYRRLEKGVDRAAAKGRSPSSSICALSAGLTAWGKCRRRRDEQRK